MATTRGRSRRARRQASDGSQAKKPELRRSREPRPAGPSSIKKTPPAGGRANRKDLQRSESSEVASELHAARPTRRPRLSSSGRNEVSIHNAMLGTPDGPDEGSRKRSIGVEFVPGPIRLHGR